MNGIEQTPEGWWVIKDDSHHAVWVRECKRLDHDIWMIKKLAPYIKAGDVILDVGANIGTHTIAYGDIVGGEGEVIAFEPHPLSFECLARNMKGRPNVTLIQGAAYNKQGFLTLMQESNNYGMTYVKESEKGDVPCIKIDSLPFDKLNYIKIDAEGSEPFVIQGAWETINKFHPFICMEVNQPALKRHNYTPEELLRLLVGFGYKYQILQDFDIKRQDENEQYDVLAQWNPSNQ